MVEAKAPLVPVHVHVNVMDPVAREPAGAVSVSVTCSFTKTVAAERNDDTTSELVAVTAGVGCVLRKCDASAPVTPRARLQVCAAAKDMLNVCDAAVVKVRLVGTKAAVPHVGVTMPVPIIVGVGSTEIVYDWPTEAELGQSVSVSRNLGCTTMSVVVGASNCSCGVPELVVGTTDHVVVHVDAVLSEVNVLPGRKVMVCGEFEPALNVGQPPTNDTSPQLLDARSSKLRSPEPTSWLGVTVTT